MHTKGNWRRSTLLAAVVVAVAAILAAPAAALAAKATTRIVAPSSKTVYNNTQGVDSWSAPVTVKLQKKVSGKYRGFTGTVKVHLYDPSAEEWVYVGSRKSSSPTFYLPVRGKYRFSFAGSSTAKPSAGSTSIYENIGLTVGTPNVTIGAEVAGQYPVTVSYLINWNTMALDAVDGDPSGIIVWRDCYFRDIDNTMWAGYAYAGREIFAPGLVEFTYKVDAPELLARYMTLAGAYGDVDDRGSYIVEPTQVEGDHPVVP